MNADIIVILTVGALGLIVLVGTWVWTTGEGKRLDKLK